MKKIFSLLLVFVFLFSFSACDYSKSSKSHSKSNPEVITRERAIELALGHAGLSRQNVYDLEAELDRERQGVFWEVDFEYNSTEYSYDINAQTEEVTRLEKERD